MTLADLVKLLETQIEVRWPDAYGLWYATVARCETKTHAESSVIGKPVGRGKDAATAVAELAARVRGALIVRDALDPARRMELRVPEDLQA